MHLISDQPNSACNAFVLTGCKWSCLFLYFFSQYCHFPLGRLHQHQKVMTCHLWLWKVMTCHLFLMAMHVLCDDMGYTWSLVRSVVMVMVVPSSGVTPTDRWLNVWCIWHTYLETLQECRSRHRIGWIIQDFRETCVSRSLTFCLETKMPWRQTPSRKKKAVVFTNVTINAYQGQLNAGFLKVCEIFKVRGIESLKYIREFHTRLVLWWHFHTPKRDAERNEPWLVVWHVGQTASWAGLDQ